MVTLNSSLDQIQGRTTSPPSLDEVSSLVVSDVDCSDAASSLDSDATSDKTSDVVSSDDSSSTSDVSSVAVDELEDAVFEPQAHKSNVADRSTSNFFMWVV